MVAWQVCNICGVVAADFSLHTPWHLTVDVSQVPEPVVATPPESTDPALTEAP
jgi:hypothetical protein